MKEIFISYSHDDEEWKKRLKKHLDVLEWEGIYRSWDDRKIKPGDHWFKQIETALNRAGAVILLISASFLSSPFIRTEEIPRILKRREQDGVPIFPFLVSACPWQQVPWLSAMQMLPIDAKPLDSFPDHEKNAQLSSLALKIADIIAKTPVKPVKHSGLMENSIFVGREAELAEMERVFQSGSGSAQVITGRLFSIAGAGGVGKTMLANEAAKRYGSQFPGGFFRVRVDEYTPMSFAVHLAGLLGEKITEPADPESAREAVSHLLKDRRLLLMLDNAVAWNDLKYKLPCETGSAILVTTRNREMYDHVRLECGGLEVSEIRLETFTPEEVKALFKGMLRTRYREADEAVYLDIGRSLGFLPLALRQAVALMVFRPRYKASELLGKLKNENGLDILRKGAAVEESNSRALEVVFDMSSPYLEAEWLDGLQYLAVCAPGPVPLDFLERLSGRDDMMEIMEGLFSHSWCNGSENESIRYYELHPLVRELVKKRFEDRFRADFVGLVDEVFRDKNIHFSVKDRWFLQLEEAFLLAREDRDERLKKWIFETICRFCINRGYGDFYIRLSEAVEELFPGDQWILKEAYVGRALILSDRGQLEEALELHKKEETICKQLGDRAGLSRTYGNQALILSDRGQLEEALELHKKEEKIKEQLGDRAGLAICWWNMGILHGKQNDFKTKLHLWEKSIQTKKDIGIPTEKNEKHLAELRKELEGE